jgi:hypothetical protein
VRPDSVRAEHPDATTQIARSYASITVGVSRKAQEEFVEELAPSDK